jgi:hypothetical protein
MSDSRRHSLSAMILLSESGEDWAPVPPWIRWFLELGYSWNTQADRRRICIVSSPCDSPAAALIALGLMRRRLEVPDAGDLASHLARLRQLQQAGGGRTILRRVNNKKRRYRFEPARKDGALWVFVEGRTGERNRILEEFAYDWHVDGEPPVQVTRGGPIANHPILQALFENSGSVLPENLARTDSAICLAGRVVGEAQTQEGLSAVRFRCDDELRSLGSLLTVHGWHDGRVSRVMYYNPRTRELDRAARHPLVVSVDGTAAYARAHADSRFADSDLIAVIPRTSESDQLEALALQLASLTQWYTPQECPADIAARVPPGVTVMLLQKD